MNYKDSAYKTPDVFENSLKNGSVLIISNGPSTNEIINYKDRFEKYFDKVISVNHGFKYFDDISDFHIVTEKPSPTNHVAEMLDEQEYNLHTPRIINWKGLPKYNQKYNLYKTVRCQIKNNFDIRRYKQSGYEGLATGPVNDRNMAVGSVTLNSIHFACMLGADNIYLVGADLIFRNKYDHFYNDNQYRDPLVQNKVKEANRIKIVEVELDGKIYQTTDYFRDSAEFINLSINSIFGNVNVYDFSKGLIKNAKQLDIKDFFKEKE